MNLMEHEVIGAPIGAEAAGEQKQTIEKDRTKIIDAAPLMERLKAAIAFGNEKGLPTDELEQVLADIEGMEELPPAQPKIIDGRLFVTVDDIKKVGCVLVDEHKSNFCRQFWMDGDGPEPCEDAVSRLGAISHFRGIADATNPKEKYNEGFVDGLEFCIAHLSTMPSVTPKQRTGKCKWCEGLKERNLRIEYYWIDEEGCTASFSAPHIVATGIARYCPNCGAKMEGVSE